MSEVDQREMESRCPQLYIDEHQSGLMLSNFNFEKKIKQLLFNFTWVDFLTDRIVIEYK